MEGIVPAPVRRSFVVVIEDPLQTFKVLLHHHVACLLSFVRVNVEVRLLEIILSFGLVRVLRVKTDEVFDELLVVFLRLGIDLRLGVQEIVLGVACHAFRVVL